MSKDFMEIKEKLTLSKEYLLQKYGISELGIFGSFSRGEETLLSDVDVLFDSTTAKNTLSLFDIVDIQTYLETRTGRTVDLVDKKSIKPALKSSILQEVIFV